MQKTCKTVINSEEQNFNKQMVEFRIFILFPYFIYVHFGQIQYFFKVLKTYFILQYIFSTSNTVWEPWWNAQKWYHHTLVFYA